MARDERWPARFVCRAVLFDLDGVLADSTSVVDRVWREWALEKGLDGEAIMKIAHGRPAREVIASVAPHLVADDEVALLEERESDPSGIVAIAGASRLLESLPAAAWAVVTSGTRPLAAARLAALGLASPDVLVTADDVHRGKPDPEGYLAAASRLGADPSECVVFEDAPAGVDAARAAGMTVIALTTTYPAKDLDAADCVVGTLERVRARRLDDDGQRLAPFELTVLP